MIVACRAGERDEAEEPSKQSRDSREGVFIYARRGSPVLSAHACAYVYTAGSPGHCQTSRRSAHTITQYVSAGVDVQDGPVVTGRPSNGGKGDQLRHVSIGHESEIKPNLPVLKYNVPILRICTYCHKAPTSIYSDVL